MIFCQKLTNGQLIWFWRHLKSLPCSCCVDFHLRTEFRYSFMTKIIVKNFLLGTRSVPWTGYIDAAHASWGRLLQLFPVGSDSIYIVGFLILDEKSFWIPCILHYYHIYVLKKDECFKNTFTLTKINFQNYLKSSTYTKLLYILRFSITRMLTKSAYSHYCKCITFNSSKPTTIFLINTLDFCLHKAYYYSLVNQILLLYNQLCN